MNAQKLLDRLTAQGFTLTPDPAGIRIQPFSRLPDKDRDAILTWKKDLLAILAATLAKSPQTIDETAETPDLPRNSHAAEGFVNRSPYLFVRDPAELPAVAQAIDNSALVGLDIETTGLDARKHRVRLLSLDGDTIDGSRFTYLVDCFAVEPSPLWPVLSDKELIAHNAGFDLAFLVRLGFQPTGAVYDTMLMAQLLAAGTGAKCSLASCAERHLGRTLDKAQQASDWSGELTTEQLDYAARDAAILLPLYTSLAAKIKTACLEPIAEIESRCLPALTWMGQNGVAFNATEWETLALRAGLRAALLQAKLNTAAPAKPADTKKRKKDAPAGWNWKSPKQVKLALELAGAHVDSTRDEALAALDHPLAAILRQHRAAAKLADSYGKDWLQRVRDGRLCADWKQIGAKSGRMSCASPNLQQLPRDPAYRRCFLAPPGRVLVKADYSQIELRVAAAITGDAAMIAAFQRGDDLHELTARSITGKDKVAPEERQHAKVANFGTLYGLSAAGLVRKAQKDYGLPMPLEDAQRYRDGFFQAYPRVAAWHRWLKGYAREVRTISGRRVLIDPAKDWYGRRAAWIVSGSAADGAKQALALLRERRGEVPGAFPVLAVHDEIVCECDEAQADAVAGWLKQAMLDGMQPLIDPVPVEIETKIGRTWAGESED